MKINEYYRNVARSSLNGSLLTLIPAILIVGGNLLFFQNKIIMLLVIPFLLYSIIHFQLYIGKVKQALNIEKNVLESKHKHSSIFMSEQLLMFFFNTLSPRLMIFFPDGCLAGTLRKYRDKKREFVKFSRKFALYDFNDELVCFYIVHGKGKLKIEVYDREREYIGRLEKTKTAPVKKNRKELLNKEGRFIGAVEGSSFYMDEQVVDSYNHQVGRLRRGWMPLEWSKYFPDPNTPVLSLSTRLSDKEKLLKLAIVINEFFLER